MEHILNHEKAHQKYFEEMTAIPHGSYHEQAYSEYLVAFAKEHGLASPPLSASPHACPRSDRSYSLSP